MELFREQIRYKSIFWMNTKRKPDAFFASGLKTYVKAGIISPGQ
jgi:hypothetical protein